MAWTPISGTVPQYSTSANELASDYWLKFYLSGTTTPYSVATDSTGASTLAKIKLSNVGYPISNPLDNDTIFIPHVEVAYRIVLYQSEADADANDTANAAFNIDGISPDIAQLATDDNIAMKGTTLQGQDDYDRSPLFVNGTDFTAGAGPHTITVPSEWTPTNADMRFYRLASNGVVTDLTPTSRAATTFTIAETLLSTDTLYIGDDTFRNQMDGDPADIRARLEVPLNSDLGSASTKDTGTGSGEVPLNSDLGSASFIDTGTGTSQIPLNSTLVPKSGGIFTGEVTYYGGGAVSTNTSYGTGALEDNTTGLQSSAFGYRVLYNQTTGGNNTGLGFRALRENTIGDNNTASGYEALRNNIGGDFNTGYGYQSLTIGTAWNNTTGLGRSAQVTGSDQVQLGNSSTTTYVYGTVQNRSDLRDKTDVRDTVLGLYFIQSLRPVDYRWDLREDYRPDDPTEPYPLEDDATDKEIEAHELALAQYENDRSEWLISVKHENLIHDGTHKRTRYHHGLIAQEVYEVIADSGVDFGGYQDHKVAGGEDVLSIGYDELIGPLIKALQELKKEFDDYVNDHP